MNEFLSNIGPINWGIVVIVTALAPVVFFIVSWLADYSCRDKEDD